MLSTLRNGFGAIPNDIVLVLDDHVIDARDVQEGMASCSSTYLRSCTW
ncbi:MAG: hypothetical protein ACXV3C_11085 [Actinomycetes bacterium]